MFVAMLVPSTRLLAGAQNEGRHVRVDWAAQRRAGIRGGGTHVLYEPGRSMFVGNLPLDIQVRGAAPRLLTCSIGTSAAAVKVLSTWRSHVPWQPCKPSFSCCWMPCGVVCTGFVVGA